MNPPASHWRAALWWVIPVAALALVLGLETDWGRHLHRLPEPPPSVEPKPVSSSVLPEYQVEGGLAGHAETVNRTLFNPTRRPAPTVAGGPRQMQRGQFLLTGTAVAGERNIAFLREVAGGKARSVRQGDQINGLLVAEVRPDRIKLTLGDETEELVLKVAPGPKTTTQPPPVPPVATPASGVGGTPVPAAAPAPVPAAETVPAERRRAAAAAAAAGAVNPPAPSPAPAGSAPPLAAPANPATPASPEATPASASPAWNEVYERMRQRNPNYPK